jgi:hypothetical protein
MASGSNIWNPEKIWQAPNMERHHMQPLFSERPKKIKFPVIQTSSKLPFHHGIWLCHLSEIDQNLMLAQRSNGITQI